MKDFGICFVGAGSIARRVLKDLPKTRRCYLAAAVSRTTSSADALCAEYGGNSYRSIDEALSDPNVRAAYIATPHTEHKKATLAAINRGIPVLCEKPFAVNSEDAGEMIATARKKGVYLAEAMWTRHNPVIKQAIEWVQNGKIGKIRAIDASFSYNSQYDPDSRIFNPAYAGGSLLDVGVYTLAFTRFFTHGAVESIAANALIENGVDLSCAVSLKLEGGVLARLYSGINTATVDTGFVYGDRGHIEIPRFWCPRKAVLHANGGDETYEAPIDGEGFWFEFDALCEDVAESRLENELVTHDHTMSVMGIMDAIRREIGLKYPFE